jgi:hypothetical protein
LEDKNLTAKDLSDKILTERNKFMISEFHVRPYFLKPRNNLNALDTSFINDDGLKSENNTKNEQPKDRQGLWLKPARPATNIVFDNTLKTNQTILKLLSTYFDYIYWPELGDPVQTTAILKRNSFIEKIVLQEQSFIHEFVQPKIVNSEHSLLLGTKSNFVINALTDQLPLQLEMALDQGFETIKFKISKNFEAEIRNLVKQNLSNFEVRIDFNSCLEAKNITDASSTLKKIPNLEYLEDPCHYTEKDWGNLAKLFPLAFDNPGATSSELQIQPFIQYYIIKPTRAISYDQILKLVAGNKKITITNMMDSPLGTWRAYLYFSLLKNEFPKNFIVPGIHTHQLFEELSFNEFLPYEKALWQNSIPELNKFVSYLDSLSWEPES